MMKQIQVSNVAPNSFKLKQTKNPTTKTTTTAAAPKRTRINLYISHWTSVSFTFRWFYSQIYFHHETVPNSEVMTTQSVFYAVLPSHHDFFSLKFPKQCLTEKKEQIHKRKTKWIQIFKTSMKFQRWFMNMLTNKSNSNDK